MDEFYTEKEIYSNIMDYYDYTLTVFETVKSMIIGTFGRHVELDIEPPDSAISESYRLGHFSGTKVVINLYNIMKAFKKDFVSTAILDIVIHELYHSTQNVDSYRYDHDTWYRDTIEGSCEWYTWNFIKGAHNVLECVLDININMNELYKEMHVSVYRINYPPKLDPDAEYWTNAINSLTNQSKNGMYNIGDMRKEIEDSDICTIEVKLYDSDKQDHIQFIKFNNQYQFISPELFKLFCWIAQCDAVFQCAKTTYKDDTCKAIGFIIYYGFKYKEDDSYKNKLPRPIIKNYTKIIGGEKDA